MNLNKSPLKPRTNQDMRYALPEQEILPQTKAQLLVRYALKEKPISYPALTQYRLTAGVGDIENGQHFTPNQIAMIDEVAIASRNKILTMLQYSQEITKPGWTLEGWLQTNWKMSLLSFVSSPQNRLGQNHIITIQTIYRLSKEQSHGNNTRMCA